MSPVFETPRDRDNVRGLKIRPLLERARRAAQTIRTLPTERRDAALTAIAESIDAQAESILAANASDMDASGDLTPALRDRLKLSAERLAGVSRAVREVRDQPDPLADRREIGEGRSGIRVTRQRVPLGVVAIVYEARPNVTAECAALTIKSGNAVILRGGKEALQSNMALAGAVRAGLEAAGVDQDAVILIEDTNREAVAELLGATEFVDLVIPRGGHGLMKIVDELARVPVVRHGQGICHAYIDAHADADKALRIAYDAKVDRPGVCNAVETLLIDASRVDDVLIPLAQKLVGAGVSIRADSTARAALDGAGITAEAARDDDWDTEFLSLVLAVRTTANLDEALRHIAVHGTHHTATIVTEDEAIARRFLDEVDASCVLWNASTRFNDGGELGLGAEMGISTSKMHAYGPMSATELTAEKLVVYGTGQTRGSGG